MADEKPRGERSLWYLPTTRNNLIGILSAGLVMPAVGFGKYYEDLHSLAPSRVVLSSAGARSDWFNVSEEARKDIPVLVELSVEFEGDAYRGETAIAAVAGVIPVSRLIAAHFASQRQADEFLARRYDNADPTRLEIQVSPGLFDAGVPTLVELRPWLQALPPVSHPAAVDVRQADALAGAALMALTCPAGTSAELDVRRVVLDPLLRGGDSVEDTIAGALGVEEWLSQQVEADRALLVSVAEALAKLSPTSRLGVRRVLADIRGLVGQSQQGSDTIGTNIARVEALLKAEAELRPLSESSGLRSAKALLLFLLRPSPDETSTWSDDMPGDPFAILGACVFSGLTAGARLLPTEVKRSDLHPIVTAIQADRINRSSPHAIERFTQPNSTTLEVRHGRNDRVVLMLGETEVVGVPADAADGAGRGPLQEPSRDAGAAERTGEDDDMTAQVSELVDLLSRADLTDPRIALLCVSACKRLEWADLVETVVEFDESGFRVERSSCVFPGEPRITLRIDRDGFLARVAALDNVSVAEFSALSEAVRAAH